MNDSFEQNNFRRLSQDDPVRQKEISRSGGLASGKSRKHKAKQKALFHELFDVAFSMEFASPEEMKEFRKWRARRNKKK